MDFVYLPASRGSLSVLPLTPLTDIFRCVHPSNATLVLSQQIHRPRLDDDSVPIKHRATHDKASQHNPRVY